MHILYVVNKSLQVACKIHHWSSDSNLRAYTQWQTGVTQGAVSCHLVSFTLMPIQNGRHFADYTFKHVFLNENVRISIKLLLKFVPKGTINNMSALVQIMAWRPTGDKPLSEPMMDAISQTTLSNKFSWMKMLEFRLNFHWSLFLREQLIICQHWFR